MSMGKSLALAVAVSFFASAAIAADRPGLGKPISEADLARLFLVRQQELP